MAVFNVPSSPSEARFAVEEFQGLNLTDTPGVIDKNKSPDAPNMIRDVPGKVRKCMGYHKVATYSGKINGYHARRGDAVGLIHAGTKLYKGQTVLYDGMANRRSNSFQMEDKLYLVDGKAILVYDGSTVVTAQSVAYIPTLTIAKSPSGGGEEYESLNLLQPKYTEMFQGNGSTKVYQMSFETIDTNNGTPIVEVEQLENGAWVKKTYGTHYTANAGTGQITFVTAPPTPNPVGEDNVKITVSRTVAGYADRVNHCDIGILFGVSGNADRLFLSGNQDTVTDSDGKTVCYRNYDWFSGQYDPTYFGDVNYGTVGAANSAVMAYTVINNYLAAIKDEFEPERNIVIRQGNLVDNEPAFPVINTLQGPGAVAKFSGAYLQTEPLFLTKLGVYAVTTSDVSGEKYSQNRSYYLDGKLREESNKETAFGFVHNDLYWLCLNNVAYILDGLQPLTSRNTPYSTRQYAGFYRTNIPANVMWEQDGKFMFGDSAGNVYEFYTEPNNPLSYNDNGAPITAYWTTPYIFGTFELNKTFRRLNVLVNPEPITSIKVSMMKKGIWSLIKEESLKTRYFSWRNLTWSKFSWSTDETPHTLSIKAKIKKADKVQYRFENNNLNEPFGILQYSAEYINGNYYKG